LRSGLSEDARRDALRFGAYADARKLLEAAFEEATAMIAAKTTDL
jgi:hypothetical protein